MNAAAAPPTSFLRKLLSGFLGYASIGAARALVPFFLLPLLTRYLTKGELGTFYLIETTIVFTSPFILSNIQGAINAEYFHLSADDIRRYVGTALATSGVAVLAATLLFCAGTAVAPTPLGIPGSLFIWIPLFAAARVLNGVALGLMQMRQRMKSYAVLALCTLAADIGLSLIGVVSLHLGLLGRLMGSVGAQALGSVAAIVWLLRTGLLTFHGSRAYLRRLASFVIPLIPHSIAGATLAMVDRYFISLTAGKEQLAGYGVAAQLASGLMLVSMAVCQAWNPILFRLYKEKGRSADAIVNPLLRKIQMAFLGCALLVWAIAEIFAHLAIDPKYNNSTSLIPWLLLGYLFQSMYMLYSSTFFYHSQTGKLAIVTVFGAAVSFAGNALLTPKIGPAGSAYAAAISWVFVYLAVRAAHHRIRGEAAEMAC